MKTVYIVRHAKSSWDNFDVSDHDRTLMQIGISKTRKIIDFFKKNKVVSDIIICSTAVRAHDTAKLIADGISYDIEGIVKSKSLYHADTDDIYSELFALNNKINTAMIIAHNPTLTDFVNNYVNPPINNLPTTGVMSISFNTNSWEKIANAKFKINFVVFPRMLS